MRHELAPTEIKALARILDELDYYRLLHVAPGSDAVEVKRAYFASSRAFHPDANRHHPAELRASAERIAKRLTEAWSVLRDPRRRRAYDQKLSSGEGVRIQLAEAEAVHEKKSVEERLGTTPNGRRYFTLAHTDIDRGDLKSAIRNLQMAQTFDMRPRMVAERG